MRAFLERAVGERTVMVLIALNTVIIFLRGFPALAEYDRWLFWVDYTLTTYFFLELAIKLGLFGAGRFFRDGWNRLDFVVIMLSTPVLLTPFFDAVSVEALMAIRCARLLRLIRSFKMIPDAERLYVGIKRALKASVGVLIAMAIYNVILALGAHALFGEVAPKYFENPMLAMYSIFRVFTVEGWHEIPDYIASLAGPNMAAFARVYFTFAVFTGGILGLSLANAVFVDEMVIDNTNHVEDRLSQVAEQLLQAQSEQQAAIAQLTEQVERVSRRG